MKIISLWKGIPLFLFTLPCFGPQRDSNANYHEGKFALNFVLPYLNTSKDVVDMCSKENVTKEERKKELKRKDN